MNSGMAHVIDNANGLFGGGCRADRLPPHRPNWVTCIVRILPVLRCDRRTGRRVRVVQCERGWARYCVWGVVLVNRHAESGRREYIVPPPTLEHRRPRFFRCAHCRSYDSRHRDVHTAGRRHQVTDPIEEISREPGCLALRDVASPPERVAATPNDIAVAAGSCGG